VENRPERGSGGLEGADIRQGGSSEWRVESAEVRVTVGRAGGGKQHKDSGPEAGGRRGGRKEEDGRRKSRSDRVVVLID
jgi:hypothetical protein